MRLDAGSFAAAYVISGGLIAFKEVSHIGDAEKPRQEYDTLNEIYLQRGADVLVAVPHALRCFNPLTEKFSAVMPNASPANRLRITRPLITPGLRPYGLLPATDLLLGQWTRSTFYP